jgi:hypothetical protein
VRAPWDSEDVKGTQDYDYQKHGKSYKGVSSQKNKAWYTIRDIGVTANRPPPLKRLNKAVKKERSHAGRAHNF